MDISQFLTVAGGGAVIVAIIEAVKRAAAWSSEQTGRIAPLFAIFLGVAITLAGTLVSPMETTLGVTLYGAVLQGIVMGATAVGIYNLGGKEVIVAAAGPAA